MGGLLFGEVEAAAAVRGERFVVVFVCLDPMVRAACDLASRELTEDEWAQYIPQRPYENLCG